LGCTQVEAVRGAIDTCPSIHANLLKANVRTAHHQCGSGNTRGVGDAGDHSCHGKTHVGNQEIDAREALAKIAGFPDAGT
jgi:hypothetical protein